jgi:signal recognition particle GTPase
VYRPAAIEQLEILGTSIGVDVFSMGTDADPAEIARLAVEKAAAEGYDTVVVDTAGRQVVDEELMEELRRVKKAGEFAISFFFLIATTPFSFRFRMRDRGGRVSSHRCGCPPTSSFCFRHPHTPSLPDLISLQSDAIQTVRPDETLLVVDAMTGQAAASLTAAFDSAVGITGAILTKLDGDSRGGAAVSIRGVSGKPIKFVGVGERTQDLEPFYPDRMASRILGMGDVISLVEKAAMTVTDAEAARMQEKMAKAEFDFDDFMAQSKLVSSMGSMAGVAKMLPGLGNMIDNSQLRMVEKRIKRSEAMICSMTKKERANPDLLLMDKSARSRVMRITKGCGLSFEDVS